MEKRIKIREILEYLNSQDESYEFYGDEDGEITSFCPINKPKSNSITWIRRELPNERELKEYHNLLILIEQDERTDAIHHPMISIKNVRRTFFRIIRKFWSDIDPENIEKGIAPTAVIDTENVGQNLYVGHHTYIGSEVEIGNDVKIYHNVTIVGRVHIGNRTVIESGTRVGVCGFGFDYDEDGNPEELPHLGGVWIGDDVKLGANNTVARGTLSDTIIEDHVKTDNLCHIAHNDVIKCKAMLAANTVISGSTIVRENAWLAPGTLLNNSIVVGENAFMGIGAVAIKNVPPNKIMAGIPVREIRDRY